MQPGNAIIDVAEGPRLLAVTPNFNLVEAFELCSGNFSTQGSGSFLSSTLPSSARTEDVVKPHKSGSRARNPADSEYRVVRRLVSPIHMHLAAQRDRRLPLLMGRNLFPLV